MNPKDYLRASDGNGEAVRAVVVEERQIGDMLINVDSVLNWPHKGIATSGVVDVDTGILDPATVAVFYYTLSGSMIHIDQFAPGYNDEGNQQYETVVLKPTTPWANAVADAAEQPSLPPGGTTGQILAKESDADGDADWVDNEGGAAVIQNETPTGAIDGSNVAFTTAFTYAAGSLQVYLNGQRLRPGASNDYQETSTGFTMVYAPLSGDVLLVGYNRSDSQTIIGTDSFIDDQTPAGTVDGSNTGFVTLQSYVGGSLQVFINGVKQARGAHYTESDPVAGGFTMSDAPLTGDIIRVSYQYATVASANADTVDGYHLSGLLEALFPVGSKYDSGASPTLPALIASIGTWERFKGRVVVGVDEAQTEFDTFGEQGGAKTHTLTTSEMPSHTHTINGAWSQNTGYGNVNIGSVAGANRANIGGTASNTGGDGAHNNLQPYETTYMWKRVA